MPEQKFSGQTIADQTITDRPMPEQNLRDTTRPDTTWPNTIRRRHRDLRRDDAGLRARVAADHLGISEAELVAAYVGQVNGKQRNTRLVDDFEAILASLEPLGRLMALTRNEHCVHERKGVYKSPEFFGETSHRHGLFLNDEIDLRLFLPHWASGFVVTDETRSGVRKSLQFFDRSGDAIHKIYLTDDSDAAAFESLASRFEALDQKDTLAVTPYAPAQADRPDSAIDVAGLRQGWAALKDTHDFRDLLMTYRVGRQQAFRLAGPGLARAVPLTAPRDLLIAARDAACPVMVFVANRGCVQIHTGTIDRLMEHGPWYNVLDPDFNLHLREDRVASCWVVVKPTVDGDVTSLEVFDADGRVIAMFFGARRPGVKERDDWRDIVLALPDRQAASG